MLGLFSFPAVGELLPGVASQTIRVGRGGIERNELVVDSQHGVPLFGSVVAQLASQVEHVLPNLAGRTPRGGVAVARVDNPESPCKRH